MTRSISIRTATALAALGLAVGVGSVAAVIGPLHESTAAAAGARTLVYTATLVPSETGGIDTGPTGISPGDTQVNVVALTRAGKRAGRVHVVGTIIDGDREGIQQNVTVFLAGGTVQAIGGGVDKPIPGATQPAGDLLAVVGGTGAYTGASGTLAISSVSPTRDRLTIRLR